MSQMDKATRKLEAFLFNGQMQDSGSEFSPCLDRWPTVNRPIEVDDSDSVLIGTIHVDLENQTETFIRNPELGKIKEP